MHKYGLFLLARVSKETACSPAGVSDTSSLPKMKSFVAKSVPKQVQEHRHASVEANPNPPFPPSGPPVTPVRSWDGE